MWGFLSSKPPLHLLVQLWMFLLLVLVFTSSLRCIKSCHYNVNSIAFCSRGVFFQSFKCYVNFIVVPRHVLTFSATWRSLNNTIWLFSQFGLMRDDTLPLIIFPVLSALLNYIVSFLRWMDVQDATDSPPLVLFQHTLSFITAAYWSAAFTEPPRMFLGLSCN